MKNAIPEGYPCRSKGEKIVDCKTNEKLVQTNDLKKWLPLFPSYFTCITQDHYQRKGIHRGCFSFSSKVCDNDEAWQPDRINSLNLLIRSNRSFLRYDA